jgi:hypothetical protein
MIYTQNLDLLALLKETYEWIKMKIIIDFLDSGRRDLYIL